MAAPAPAVLQFTPFSSIVQPAFWHELTKLKIDVLKLSQDTIPIHGSYSSGRAVTDRETGQEVALGCNLVLGEDAFSNASDIASIRPPPHSVVVRGLLKNYNTIEDFKNANKAELFNDTTKEMWTSTTSTGETSHLSQFLLITFADLKKYKYYYWFAFPAFASVPPWQKVGEWSNATEVVTPDGLKQIYQAIHAAPSASIPQSIAASILARPSANDATKYETAPLEKFSDFFARTPSDQRLVIFTDPSAHAHYVGWPLRNILTYIQYHHAAVAALSESTPLNVIAWRDVDLPSAERSTKWRSIAMKTFVPVKADITSSEGIPAAVGWERNATGKLGPRMADLAPMMDPTRLADQAVDLNLKLMRWRVLPGLDLEKMSGTKCLLLGAGTLGCYVARTLMAWGVRKITFVDSARVSFSNPVRQPLFEFDDCLDGGKPKAATAAARLKKIFPGIDASGHELMIPMPGHPIPPQSVEQTKVDVAKLEKLVDEHDAMFLLMDSRESRWLPTVMGASKGKIIINCALGFDTYLVMRHGPRETLAMDKAKRLGCYYCNDIVAPADSLKDQTLDQMCTVTRPGLAAIASATAVELLATVLQHPKGINAPAPPAVAAGASQDRPSETDEHNSVLGIVPHQLRGYLARFNTMLITGAAFGNCTGCSEAIIRAYETEGFPMLLKVFNELGYLERVTGLDKLHSDGEAAFENMEWDEEEE